MPPKKPGRPARGKKNLSPVQSLEGDVDDDAPGGQDGDPLPAKKRPTVADNAKSIQSMQADISTMSGMLSQLTQRLCAETPEAPQTTHVAPAPSPATAAAADPEAYTRGRARTAAHAGDTCRPVSVPSPPKQTSRDRHTSAGPHWRDPCAPPGQANNFFRSVPPRRRPFSEMDPLIRRPGYRPHRDFPTSLRDLEDDADLQTKMASFISASLVPMAQSTGKKVFAHSFIARGTKRSRTTLGDLSIPEYTTGFIRMINHPSTPQHVKPHLEWVNEDAINYEWADVRAWSEEVCALVAEGDLTWDDKYHLDLMRIKLSQDQRKHPSQAGGVRDLQDRDTGNAVTHPLTSDLKAAKPDHRAEHSMQARALTLGTMSQMDIANSMCVPIACP